MRPPSIHVRKDAQILIFGILGAIVVLFASPIEVAETSKSRVIGSLFFVLAAALSLVWSSVRYGDYFSPIGLMGGGWFGAIALSVLNLSPVYQTVWGVELWTALLASLAMFWSGALSYDRLFGVGEQKTTPDFNEQKLHYLAILALFGVGFASFLVQLLRLQLDHGLLIYVQNPGQAETAFWMFGVGYLYLLNFLNSVLCLMYLYRYGVRRSVAIILGLSIFSMPFHLIKTVIMATMFALLMVVHYFRDRGISLAHLFLGFAAMIAFFVAYAFFIGQGSSWYISTGRIRFPEELSPLVQPYLYAATNFANVQAALQATDIRHTWGLRSLEPAFKVTILYDLLGMPELLKSERPTVTDVYLTNSYIGMLYMDYGWAGILLGPFVYGFISQGGYSIARWTNSAFAWAGYSYIAFACAFAFFWNYYSQFFMWEFGGICLILFGLARSSSPEPLDHSIISNSLIINVATRQHRRLVRNAHAFLSGWEGSKVAASTAVFANAWSGSLTKRAVKWVRGELTTS